MRQKTPKINKEVLKIHSKHFPEGLVRSIGNFQVCKVTSPGESCTYKARNPDSLQSPYLLHIFLNFERVLQVFPACHLFT